MSSNLAETIQWAFVAVAAVAIIGFAASCEATRIKVKADAEKRGNCVCAQ